MPSRAAGLVACVLACTPALACAPAAAPARDVRVAQTQPRDANARINQFELQEDVQRFTGNLLTRMGTAVEPLADGEASPTERERALNFLLNNASAALDIASGPLPEINVLDMVVLVSLTRSTIERYWLPEVFGPGARPLLAAFETSEAEAWELASKILSPEHQRHVASLIEAWLVDNPETVNVTLLRFQEFSELAGQAREDEQQKTRGLLSSVRAATQTADQALLLAERAMFLAQRVPFLLRLQARLGTQEVIDDSVRRITSHEFSAMVPPELRALSSDSRETIRELKLLLGGVEPLLSSGELKQTLDAARDLTGEGLALVRELHQIEPGQAAEAAAALEHRAARFSDRLLLRVFLCGAGLISLFWVGYCLAKRFSRKLSDSGPDDQRRPGARRLGHA